jgi:hypothetical protein
MENNVFKGSPYISLFTIYQREADPVKRRWGELKILAVMAQLHGRIDSPRLCCRSSTLSPASRKEDEEILYFLNWIAYEAISSSCFFSLRFSTTDATNMPTSYNISKGIVARVVVKISGDGDTMAPTIMIITIA